jgi:hypothetical protein
VVATAKHAELYDTTFATLSAALFRGIFRSQVITKLTVEPTQDLISWWRIRWV